MNKTKIAISICASLVLLAAFQNCGAPRSATSVTTNGEGFMVTVEPVEKTIAQYSVPLDFRSVERAELRSDGSVINMSTGASYAIDATLKKELSKALAAAEVCAYKVHIPKDAAVCMMMAVPHAFATAADGQEFELAVQTCGSDTFDLCPGAHADFALLMNQVRDAIRTPQ